jgi:sulfite dehydrogenase (quinone) subunit SoeC
MNPAFSVIFLTTLIGAGQGLFLALFAAELSGRAAAEPMRSVAVSGAALALALTALGLVASFFHLGRPERAWRAAAQWRTSWLSREVIALPLFMAGVAAWGGAHLQGAAASTALGAMAAALCAALFVCTAMIYASIRFLREWASPLTLVNYTLLGCASGFTLACALAAVQAPVLLQPLALAAAGLTLAGATTRVASLRRNAALRPKSTPQTALGIKHPRIQQKSQGFMGGSYNTREFFHGRSPARLLAVKWFFLVAAFALPVPALWWGASSASAAVLVAAFAVQYLGLLAERWYFFAQANHPQNIYYQAIS